jgi:hypothetical protein
MTASRVRPRWALPAGSACIGFGLVTVAVGGRTLFHPLAAGLQRGIVPLIRVFNFVAGFAYVAAGIGLLRARRWAFSLSVVIAAATLLLFIALGAHIAFGGDFQMRTVAAMTLRTVFWIGIATGLYRAFVRGPAVERS